MRRADKRRSRIERYLNGYAFHQTSITTLGGKAFHKLALL